MNGKLLFLLTGLVFFAHGMDEWPDIGEHPLMIAMNLEMLYNLALKVSDGIDSAFPAKKQVLVGLGQSPAYLLEMIKLIDERKHRADRSYLHVAFSGHRASEGGASGPSQEAAEDRYAAAVIYYKKYLGDIGLSDDDLRMSDVEYIILEVCHHGEGLKSFLKFFDAYDKKPKAFYLQSEETCSVALPIPSCRYALRTPNELLLMHALANADEFRDRLVPHFHVYAGSTVDPLASKPRKNAAVLLEKLQEFVFSKPTVIFDGAKS